MTRFLKYATSFDQDLSSWDVGRVTSMDSMFWGAKLFNCDLSNWDISSVSTMASMFSGATNFNQELCWNVSETVDTDNAFTNSRGSFDCPASLTPTRSPSDVQTGFPTTKPTPTRSPSDVQTGFPTTKPTYSLTFTPSTSPLAVPTTGPAKKDFHENQWVWWALTAILSVFISIVYYCWKCKRLKPKTSARRTSFVGYAFAGSCGCCRFQIQKNAVP